MDRRKLFEIVWAPGHKKMKKNFFSRNYQKVQHETLICIWPTFYICVWLKWHFQRLSSSTLLTLQLLKNSWKYTNSCSKVHMYVSQKVVAKKFLLLHISSKISEAIAISDFSVISIIRWTKKLLRIYLHIISFTLWQITC